MPLNPASLQSAFKRLSTTEKPPDPNTAALKIAQAYQQYTLQGLAGGFPIVSGGPGMATMHLPLVAAFSVLPGAPPMIAQAYVAMVTAYWAGAVVPALPFPGIAAPPAGVAALQAALLPIFSVPNNPVDLYALQVATALDVCTRTVLVTFPQPPPAPPLIFPVV